MERLALTPYEFAWVMLLYGAAYIVTLHPQDAGTSTSVGGVMIFLCGGVISVVINLASEDLTTALASCFLILSIAGLGLNTLIGRPPSCRSELVESSNRRDGCQR
jgi:DHA1 family bicyclomycin/chloramphenicol resistance-like MFS transporter